MLGSSFAGERDNAARLAEAFMKRHGLTWADLEASGPDEAAPHPTWEPEPEPQPHWARMPEPPLWHIFQKPPPIFHRPTYIDPTRFFGSIAGLVAVIALLMMAGNVPFPRSAGSGGESPPIHLVAH